MATAPSPRHAEVEELKAVEEYIRKERAECEALERQIVEMAMSNGISQQTTDLGEDPYQASPAAAVREPGEAPSPDSKHHPGDHRAHSTPLNERRAAAVAESPLADPGTIKLVTQVGRSRVAILAPRTRAARERLMQSGIISAGPTGPSRSRSRGRGANPSFTKATRFQHDAETPVTGPGPGAYNIHHSDFSGHAGVTNADDAAVAAAVAALGGGDGHVPATSATTVAAQAKRKAAARSQPTASQLTSLLDAAHSREKDLRRQVAAMHRRLDEARTQLTAYQNHTQQRIKAAEATAAKRTAVAESARGRVSAMRRSFGDVQGAAAALCSAIADSEDDFAGGAARKRFTKLRQLAYRLQTTADAAAPVFAAPAAQPSALAGPGAPESGASGLPAVHPQWAAMQSSLRGGADKDAPPNSIAGRAASASAAGRPSPFDTPPPPPGVPASGARHAAVVDEFLPPGVDTSAVSEFARRTVTAEQQRVVEEREWERTRKDLDSIANVVGAVGSTVAARSLQSSGLRTARSRSRSRSRSPFSRRADPRGLGASASPTRRHAADVDGVVRAKPAEEVRLRRMLVGVREVPATLSDSPVKHMQLSVEQRVRLLFAHFAGNGARDKEATAMRHTGWGRFTREAGIVPAMLTPADIDIAFSREVAARTAGTQLGGTLTFDMFMNALADVACRVYRGPEAPVDDEADQDALRRLLTEAVLPLFDRLGSDSTFVFDTMRVGAAEDLEAFSTEFLSDGVIRFFNENKGAFRSLFLRFAKLEDPGKQPRGSLLNPKASSPADRSIQENVRRRHAGWQEVQRQQQQVSRWAFGQLITTMKLAPGILNRRDLLNIFRSANRGVCQNDYPDALSYTEFVEFLALVATNAYGTAHAFPSLVDKIMLLIYDMSQRGASFMGEEQRLVRTVTRVVKRRLAEADATHKEDTTAAAAKHRSLVHEAMVSAEAVPAAAASSSATDEDNGMGAYDDDDDDDDVPFPGR